MTRNTKSGFTEAEQAVLEWAQKNRPTTSLTNRDKKQLDRRKERDGGRDLQLHESRSIRKKEKDIDSDINRRREDRDRDRDRRQDRDRDRREDRDRDKNIDKREDRDSSPDIRKRTFRNIDDDKNEYRERRGREFHEDRNGDSHEDWKRFKLNDKKNEIIDERCSREPRNPLQDAYDINKFRSQRRGRERFRSESRERFWDNDIFMDRSPSPDRDFPEEPTIDTRASSWRSRAGGVYLPPLKSDSQDEN